MIPIIYNYITDFYKGLAKVGLNNKEGFIDKTGNLVIQIVYDRIYDFREGLAAVGLNNKEGFIDKTGKVVIPIVYDDIGVFVEGRTFAVRGNEILLVKYRK